MRLQLSLSKRLTIITASVAVIALGSLIGNMVAQHRYVSIVEQSETMGKAARFQAMADMNHDGSKGSLYRIFYALNFNKDGISDAQNDLNKQTADLKMRLDQLNALVLPDEVRAKVNSLTTPFENYVKDAHEIANIAVADFKKVNARLPAFEASFDALAKVQDVAGEAILAEATSLTEQSHSLAKMTELGSMIGILVLITLFASLFSFVRGWVAKPLSTIAGHIHEIGAGTLTKAIDAGGRKDEIGIVLEALEDFRTQSAQTKSLQLAASKQAENELLRRKKVDTAVAEFQSVISNMKLNLSGGIQGLLVASTELSEAVTHADESTRSGANSSEKNTVIVQQIAHATHEMQMSIKEVANQIDIAASAVLVTSQLAASSSANVTQLASSAQEIDSIVVLIRAIASQTNLLALNATIEAARAGDAGRGFAIVASEVKALAGQTAQATNAIAEQITSVKTCVDSTVDAIGKMVGTFAQVEGAIASIASVLDQQNEAARDIARSAETAASSVNDMNNVISKSLNLVENTTGSAQLISDVSKTLNTQSDELSQSVDSFLDQVKAA
jgi:methyl-accepting chemotaxis protein